MLGAIIGDIVGSRFEFKNYRGTDFELFHKGCSFTDDTVCTVAVAEAILDRRDFDEALMDWCERYPNPTGGYGINFNKWLLGFIKGPYKSFGNGSAMRVSPCGWLLNQEDALQMAELSATVTHNHPEGIKGAVCIADLIWQLRNGSSKRRIEGYVTEQYRYAVNVDLTWLRKYNEFDETCQVTVPQAIACFLQSKNFEDCIRLAVSIGGDTDTIAAIAGSLAEAHYGIPEQILAKAMEYLPMDIKEVIHRFYSTNPIATMV